MSRRTRRLIATIGLLWAIVGAVQIPASALGWVHPGLLITVDVAVVAAAATVGILIHRHGQAVDTRQRRRADELLDAVTMTVAPVDAAYAIAYEQGKQAGRLEHARQLAVGDKGGQLIQFPPATYPVERSRPAADETTVPLSPEVATLVPGRARVHHARPAPHPRPRR